MTESFSYGSRDLRIGDAEREAAVQSLGEHFVAGRLDIAEHEERIGRAYAAKMGSDLDDLFQDLPRLRPAPERSDQRPRQVPRRRSGFPIPVLLFPLIALAFLLSAPFVLIPLVWVGIFLLASRSFGSCAPRSSGRPPY